MQRTCGTPFNVSWDLAVKTLELVSNTSRSPGGKAKKRHAHGYVDMPWCFLLHQKIPPEIFARRPSTLPWGCGGREVIRATSGTRLDSKIQTCLMEKNVWSFMYFQNPSQSIHMKFFRSFQCWIDPVFWGVLSNTPGCLDS